MRRLSLPQTLAGGDTDACGGRGRDDEAHAGTGWQEGNTLPPLWLGIRQGGGAPLPPTTTTCSVATLPSLPP